MSKEDLELLKAVREWRPPQELHPAAVAAWQIYEGHGNALPPEALDEVRALFDSYGDDLLGLAAAMEGVIRFLIYVGEHLGDAEAARRITEVLREYVVRYEPFWERVAQALDNVGDSSHMAFRRFIAPDRAAKTAPTLGAAAPKGSIPLKDLNPPGRPPPWTKG